MCVAQSHKLHSLKKVRKNWKCIFDENGFYYSKEEALIVVGVVKVGTIVFKIQPNFFSSLEKIALIADCLCKQEAYYDVQFWEIWR